MVIMEVAHNKKPFFNIFLIYNHVPGNIATIDTRCVAPDSYRDLYVQ